MIRIQKTKHPLKKNPGEVTPNLAPKKRRRPILLRPPSGPAAAPDDAVVGITKPPALLELEELLGERFDTKVGINLGTKRGRLTIDFADIDDLERIYALMTGE